MKYKITLDGHTYEIEVVEDKAMVVDEYEAYAPTAPAPVAAAPAPVAAEAPAPAPAPAAVTGAGEAINAPMPGTVLSVKVSAGQTVTEGTVLVVLEAMKMENEITAPKSGTVTQVVVQNGASVDTGAPLVIIQ